MIQSMSKLHKDPYQVCLQFHLFIHLQAPRFKRSFFNKVL